ncbi:type VI secretion protein IcmF/TssM N-terminal domain-containing protein [Desulfamplus magnetovallimortis]|nr:type VI secretion protein IcmF/TssM N-terminal domain-containing protein [Desulfamplus magnetovallimortis]
MIYIKGWQWWFFACFAGGIIGIIFAVLAIRRYLVRRNEKKFVQRVIREDAEKIPQGPEEDSQKEMLAKWKYSIAKLQHSHLRRKGNPLYVLPWFLVMGETGSGKTSALKNTNLSSPLTDVSEDAIHSGTKDCDWWFFDHSVVLDTAGRYTLPVDESVDRQDFEAFLVLLAKYRKKEPLNGVVVTISVDSLLNDDDLYLSEKAKNIRKRINQIMRVMGVKFPVYLLVTKMDLVNGFTDFCEHIPVQRESQVMGYLNEKDNVDALEILDSCMASVFNQLKKLRTIFVQNRLNSSAILFPTEFIRLKQGLTSCVKALFGEDTYQATPFFRGIYFSSAHRTKITLEYNRVDSSPLPNNSSAASNILIKGQNTSSANEGTGNRQSFFLRNFFHFVLPWDRNIFTPITEFIMWRKTTVGFGVFSLMVIILAFCELLTLSYYNNVKALNSFDRSVFLKMADVSDINDNLLALDRQRFEIEKLEAENKEFFLPRLGLVHSKLLEKRLKERYLEQVQEQLVKPLDRFFFDAVDQLNSKTSYQDVVNYAVYAVGRIALLKRAIGDAKLLNEKIDGEREFEKSIESLFPSFDNKIRGTIAIKFASVYRAYLRWFGNDQFNKKVLQDFQAQLAKIADRSGGFRWLVSSSVCSASDITIADFFKGYDIQPNELRFRVKGAFTSAGRDDIREFVKLIKNAFPTPEAFVKMEESFWAWYTTEFYRAWNEFVVRFPKGNQWDRVTRNWQDAANLMVTSHNPYFLLLDVMADQFELLQKSQGEGAPSPSTQSDEDVKLPWQNKDKVPAWTKMVIRVKKIRHLAETEKKKESGSLMAKLSLQKEKVAGKLLGGKAKKAYETFDSMQATEMDFNLLLARSWTGYEEALKLLSSATSHREKCYYMVSDFFSVLSDPSKEGKAYQQVNDALVDLDTLIKQSEASSEVYELIKGPFDYFKHYGIHHSIYFLQDKWEEMVLSASENVEPGKYNSVMFDRANGLIWKFTNEYANPFLDRNKTGYFARTAFGMTLPFDNSFFRLLDKGEGLILDRQQDYTVTIQTLPVNVNNEAMIKPHSSKLVLECADQKSELLNNNFPETKLFKWNPETCGDVTLSIQFRDIEVEKTYTGQLGFAGFLQDFKDGRKIFNVSDFPEQMSYLTSNAVSDIFVAYDIKGIEPVLRFLKRTPPAIPETIFKEIKKRSGKYPPVAVVPQESHAIKPKVNQTSEPSDPLQEMVDKKKKFNIFLETLPMEVNETAEIKPVSTIFWMNCNNNIVRVENNNYPVTAEFEWDPATCGKLILLIHFPEITLFKEYDHFLEFLQEFNYHSRTFTSDDFPDQKEALLKNSVSSITITYNFSGDLPLREAQSIPLSKEKTLSPNEEKTTIIKGKEAIPL